jgi:hypothetical protein
MKESKTPLGDFWRREALVIAGAPQGVIDMVHMGFYTGALIVHATFMEAKQTNSVAALAAALNAITSELTEFSQQGHVDALKHIRFKRPVQ